MSLKKDIVYVGSCSDIRHFPCSFRKQDVSCVFVSECVCVCVCVGVCVCVRACVRVCGWVCERVRSCMRAHACG